MVTDETYFLNLNNVFVEITKLLKTDCFQVNSFYSHYKNDNMQGIRSEEINTKDDFCFFIYKFVNEYKFSKISVGNYRVNPPQVFELRIDANTGQLINCLKYEE